MEQDKRLLDPRVLNFESYPDEDLIAFAETAGLDGVIELCESGLANRQGLIEALINSGYKPGA